jgi:CHAT domain-containing protein
MNNYYLKYKKYKTKYLNLQYGGDPKTYDNTIPSPSVPINNLNAFQRDIIGDTIGALDTIKTTKTDSQIPVVLKTQEQQQQLATIKNTPPQIPGASNIQERATNTKDIYNNIIHDLNRLLEHAKNNTEMTQIIKSIEKNIKMITYNTYK